MNINQAADNFEQDLTDYVQQQPANERNDVLVDNIKTVTKRAKKTLKRPNILFLFGDDHGVGDTPWANPYLAGNFNPQNDATRLGPRSRRHKLIFFFGKVSIFGII